MFEELKLLTQGFTRLGPSYELEQQSLVVEGESSWRDLLGNSSEFCLHQLQSFIPHLSHSSFPGYSPLKTDEPEPKRSGRCFFGND